MTRRGEDHDIIDEIVAALEGETFDFANGRIVPDDEVDRMFGIVRKPDRAHDGPSPAA